MLNLGCIFEVRLWLTVVLILDRKVLVNLENFDQFLCMGIRVHSQI